MGNQLTLLKLIKPISFKQGSVIVVIGATGGIGSQIAQRYAQRKLKLVLSGRNEEVLQNLANECSKMGSTVKYVVADVEYEDQSQKIIEAALKTFGRIDILVLSSGINAHARFEHIKDLNVFQKLMDVNFFGYLYPTYHALPYLKKNQGQIIVISSLSGEIGLPYRTAYCSSKYAITGFFESLRIEEDDIAITIICPPSVQTNMREQSILKIESPSGNDEIEDDRISVEKCVDTIIAASDRRARKVYFPLKSYIAVYMRPIFPDFVDKRLKVKAKL